MTLQVPSNWACPVCQIQHTAAIWKTVNATLNPELAACVADGSLFQVACQRCGYSGRFNYSCQFHDMTRLLYCIYHCPNEPETQEDQQFMQYATTQFAPGYQFRNVYDLDALMELVSIWRDGLDDPTMLCLRLMLSVQVQEARGAYPDMIRYYRQIHDPDHAFEYVILVPDAHEPISMLAPAYLYENHWARMGSARRSLFPPGRWIEWTNDTAMQAMRMLG